MPGESVPVGELHEGDLFIRKDPFFKDHVFRITKIDLGIRVWYETACNHDYHSPYGNVCTCPSVIKVSDSDLARHNQFSCLQVQDVEDGMTIRLVSNSTEWYVASISPNGVMIHLHLHDPKPGGEGFESIELSPNEMVYVLKEEKIKMVKVESLKPGHLILTSTGKVRIKAVEEVYLIIVSLTTVPEPNLNNEPEHTWSRFMGSEMTLIEE